MHSPLIPPFRVWCGWKEWAGMQLCNDIGLEKGEKVMRLPLRETRRSRNATSEKAESGEKVKSMPGMSDGANSLR